MSRVESSDPYDILLGHNRWATAELLKRCRALSEEEFHRGFDIGPGSLHDTLTHIIGAMRRWSDRIDGGELRPRIEGARRTPEELLGLLDEAAVGFAAMVGRSRLRLAEVREWVFGAETYRFTVAAAILHVTNHGMHHRAQCMNMFKRLGKPVGADLDELEWVVGEGDGR